MKRCDMVHWYRCDCGKRYRQTMDFMADTTICCDCSQWLIPIASVMVSADTEDIIKEFDEIAESIG